MTLFVYGTLRHPPLLELVAGPGACRTALAALADHAVLEAGDGSYPRLVAKKGARAEGLALHGLTEAAVARLDFYESLFGYTLHPVTIDRAGREETALVYLPDASGPAEGADFSLDAWVRDWSEISLRAAAEAMIHYGRSAPDEIGRLMPFFRARGWAGMLAQKTAPRSLRADLSAGDVKITEELPGHDGFFRLRALKLKHRRFDGSWSGEMPREVTHAFDAALVLPYDPATDRVHLIEQLRFGPLVRGDDAPWVLEPIAGLVDAGEDPETCARREAVEEAGLHLGDLEPMVRIYASPGYSTEFFHCFLGLTDLSEADEGVGGLEGEHEDIRSHVISFGRAMDLIDSGEINGGPLVMMLLWLARHRDRLRKSV